MYAVTVEKSGERVKMRGLGTMRVAVVKALKVQLQDLVLCERDIRGGVRFFRAHKLQTRPRTQYRGQALRGTGIWLVRPPWPGLLFVSQDSSEGVKC